MSFAELFASTRVESIHESCFLQVKFKVSVYARIDAFVNKQVVMQRI